MSGKGKEFSSEFRIQYVQIKKGVE